MIADAGQIAAYFDDLGTGEWDRLEATLHGRIKYAIHRRYLLDAIQPGMRVLDAGCGPGRFAIDCARAGAPAISNGSPIYAIAFAPMVL